MYALEYNPTRFLLFITAPIIATIKDEPIDVPEGLVPRTPTQVPLAQRDRATLRTAEDKALDAARSADRAAKYHLKSKIEKKDSYKKLEDNSFNSKEAKEEWQRFRDGLTPEELAVVTNKDWEQVEPPSAIGALGLSDDALLQSDKPYIEGKDNDECEEELDEDSDIDAYYNEFGNEYETEEQWEEAKAMADKDDETDWGNTTDFEGFSD
ncbi:hypothetical protein TW65_06140 [Stemphylium lycopersici]|nr:hypothetical protein TW65_06140 [Stemphylium lycopersici]